MNRPRVFTETKSNLKLLLPYWNVLDRRSLRARHQFDLRNGPFLPSVFTPVFKKRPNFLNSWPTNTEGERRLLSAPSGRFWQQTAICPISLWALVVELHPLNWARAQAVLRINPTNSYVKSSVFFWTRGDSGQCDKTTARNHRKCVPGNIPTMEETLGTVYRQ
jgi:hypothetical protein